MDGDIGRQLSLAQVHQIVQIRHILPGAPHKRLQKASFQIAGPDRLLQGEGREDGQIDLGVFLGPLVERVDQQRRFSQAHRHADFDIITELLDDKVNALFN